MLVALVCILTLQGVRSACVLKDICPEDTAVQAEIVDVHNAFRRAVEPPAADMLMMSYSEELAVSAQAWVDKCVLDHGPPSSRMLNGYELGENLFYSTSPMLWKSIINAWYKEVSHFAFPNASTNGKPVGHYTQVVWNSSYKVGCGVTLCSNNIYLYGCHYYRAGNFKRWPPYKVGTPCASCPNDCVDKLCTNPCPYINRFLNCPAMKALGGCQNPRVSSWCPASCKCSSEIIPVY
ncbi:cysteine-rich venom protein pseudecin-like [Oryzias latipes]|uniref:cysteine-rich venom protein pseudecin-like n=1 Tax=Oryzias latipes TaxID=8090 RepID=UPI0005CC17B1|nr:cysteine-rich venom protein pseudecin-like [Oryzias latipes]XP_011484137.1 cysteine-rich venom protein pseudecin-like [Oryzias latipes]